MSQTVLVANRYAPEARGIATALGSAYDTKPVTDRAALISGIGSATALVLDSNFSEAQGVDVLADVLGRVHLPVLMITPLSDQACAVEAMRCGATGYLVKTETYSDLLITALGDAIHRAGATGFLKREIVELRRRVAELEGKGGIATVPGSGAEAEAAEEVPRTKGSVADELISRMRNGALTLPSYPQVAVRLRELLDTDVGITEIARLLSQDAATSAKLLQMANSALYPNARRVESVEHAVSRLGLTGACTIAEIIANRSLYVANHPTYAPYLNELWLHSVACAHACVALGKLVQKSVSPKLFSLGLLHDAGKLAILQAIVQSDPHGRLMEGRDSAAAFHAFMRAQHLQFGVAILQRWRFDEDFLMVARHHDDLDGASTVSRPLLIVHLANLVARARGYGDPLESPDVLDRAPSRLFLFPGGADLDAIGDEVDRAVTATRGLLAD